MMTPKRSTHGGQTALERGVVNTAWQEQMDRRITRIETVLTKLAMHMGMDPRTGQPVSIADAKR